MNNLFSVSYRLSHPSLHGWSCVLEALETPAETEDGHLQQPRRDHAQKQEALPHLQDRGP